MISGEIVNENPCVMEKEDFKNGNFKVTYDLDLKVKNIHLGGWGRGP